MTLYGTTLAGLVLFQAPVDAIFNIVGWAYVATKLGTVHLDKTARLIFNMHLIGHGLAEFVGQNKGRFALAVKIAGKLQ